MYTFGLMCTPGSRIFFCKKMILDLEKGNLMTLLVVNKKGNKMTHLATKDLLCIRMAFSRELISLKVVLFYVLASNAEHILVLLVKHVKLHLKVYAVESSQKNKSS